MTLVISPLLALMENQIHTLQSHGISVQTINSTTPLTTRRKIIADLLSGHPRTRLLYITPEYCQTDAFRRTICTVHAQRQLARIAIDEAHCVSEWGHDFRPAYKALGWFRRELQEPTVPMTAVTATATRRVRGDILSLLGLQEESLKKFEMSSARPNIHYEVRYWPYAAEESGTVDSRQVEDVVDWLTRMNERRKMLQMEGPVTGIIYVPLRSTSSELAREIMDMAPFDVKAIAYHAGLTTVERKKIHQLWSTAADNNNKNKTGAIDKTTTSDEQSALQNLSFLIVIATTAFGMGIDNQSVRFVVHWTPPRSFEGFVQESGRAGRDGKAAVSRLYYNPVERDRVVERLRCQPQPQSAGGSDGAGNEVMVAAVESLRKVVRFCEYTDRCRHRLIRVFCEDEDVVDGVGNGDGTDLCDFACDFCKEGGQALERKRMKMETETEREREERGCGDDGRAAMMQQWWMGRMVSNQE